MKTEFSIPQYNHPVLYFPWTTHIETQQCSTNDDIYSAIVSWIQSMKQNNLIKVSTYMAPQQHDLTIYDVSFFSSLLENQAYAESEILQFILRRGLSYTYAINDTKCLKPIVLRRGFPKFYDLCTTVLSTQNAQLIQDITSPETIVTKQFNHRLCSIENLNNYQFHLISVDKLNGSNAQISWNLSLNSWVCCSKNVSMIVASREDLLADPYSATRFKFASIIASYWFDIIDTLTIVQVDMLKNILKDHTLVGELVGLDSSQHIVLYTIPELLWFGCVPHNGHVMSWTPNQLDHIFKTIDSDKLKLAPQIEKQEHLSYNSIRSAICDTKDRIELASLKEAGEGRVFYIIAYSLSDDNETVSLSHFSNNISKSLKSEILIGLFKCKTFEYRLLRKLRMKCCRLASCKPEDVSHHIQPLMSAYHSECSQFLLVSKDTVLYESLISQYSTLLQRCLLYIVKHRCFNRQYIQNSFLDFLKAVTSSSDLDINHNTPKLLEIHLIIPPFLLNDQVIISLQTICTVCLSPIRQQAMDDASMTVISDSSNRLKTRIFIWHNPFIFILSVLQNKSPDSILMHTVTNYSDSLNDITSLLIALPSHKTVFIWGYTDQGIREAINRGTLLINALKTYTQIQPIKPRSRDSNYTQEPLEVWTVDMLLDTAILDTETTVSIENVLDAYHFYWNTTYENQSIHTINLKDICKALNEEELSLLSTSTTDTLETTLKMWESCIQTMISNSVTVDKIKSSGKSVQQFIIIDDLPPLYANDVSESSLLKKIIGMIQSLSKNDETLKYPALLDSQIRDQLDASSLSSTILKKETESLINNDTQTLLHNSSLLLDITFVLLMGLPGSGKSTIAEGLLDTARRCCQLNIQSTSLATILLKDSQTSNDWIWDMTIVFQSDVYLHHMLHHDPSMNEVNRSETEFRKCQRISSIRLNDDIKKTLTTYLVEYLFKQLYCYPKDSLQRPFKVLMIIDKNHSPSVILTTKFNFQKHMQEVAYNITHHSDWELYSNHISYPEIAASMTVLMMGESCKYYPAQFPESCNNQLSSLRTFRPEWNYPWSIESISDIIKRAIFRQNHLTLQQSSALNILLSFLKLYEGWDIHRLVTQSNLISLKELSYSFIVIPTVSQHNETDQWYTSMSELIRLSLNTFFKPFETNLHNTLLYSQIETLCQSQQEYRDTLPDAVQHHIQSCLNDAKSQLETVDRHTAKFYIDLETTVYQEHTSTDDQTVLNNEVNDMLIKDKRGSPVYGYVDVTHIQWLNYITLLSNQCCDYFPITTEEFRQNLKKMNCVETPHITMTYFGKWDQNNTHPLYTYFISGLKQLNTIYQFRLHSIIYCWDLIVIASIIPIDPEQLNHSFNTEQPTGNSNDALLQIIEPGRYLHVTLATGPHIPPKLSLNVLQAIDHLKIPNFSLYHTPRHDALSINDQPHIMVPDIIIGSELNIFIKHLLICIEKDTYRETECYIHILRSPPIIEGKFQFFYNTI